LSISFKVGIVEIFFQRAGKRDGSMPQVGDVDVDNSLELLGNAQVRNHPFTLFAEYLVGLQSRGSIHMRHLEVVLCGSRGWWNKGN
jgi:hypothetical protein